MSTTYTDFDRIAEAWLAEGPAQLSDRVLDAALGEVHLAHQRRRRLSVPRRNSTMNKFAALGAAAVVVLGVVGVVSLTRRDATVPGTTPTPIATPSAPSSASPTADAFSLAFGDPTTWHGFTSERYLYSLRFPADWSSERATADWNIGEHQDITSAGVDRFISPTGSIRMSAWSVPVPAGKTAYGWIKDYCTPPPGDPGWCDEGRAIFEDTLVDGHRARAGGTGEEWLAFVPIDDKVFVFAVWQATEEPLFRAWLDTIHIPSIDPDTFVMFQSDQYAIKVGHPPGWAIERADHTWSMSEAAAGATSGQDAFIDPEGDVRVSAWSVPFDPATYIGSQADIETWVTAYCQAAGRSDCDTIHDRAVPLCVEHADCHPALLVPFADSVQAFFCCGVHPADRMTIVAVWQPDDDASVQQYGGGRKLLQSFLATMNVWPGKAR
ncbi:MAG TPA: hypothetical protein VFV72_09720 [Candidatus Limnocylindrales bacterium]|nr:hypothetical protein [Candidatus Limnocylindrales bacterium]